MELDSAFFFSNVLSIIERWRFILMLKMEWVLVEVLHSQHDFWRRVISNDSNGSHNDMIIPIIITLIIHTISSTSTYPHTNLILVWRAVARRRLPRVCLCGWAGSVSWHAVPWPAVPSRWEAVQRGRQLLPNVCQKARSVRVIECEFFFFFCYDNQ